MSLMNVGMSQLQPDITHAKVNPAGQDRVYDRYATWNPISGSYRTRDGRFINLTMQEADRYGPNLWTVIGYPELIDDPRFIDMAAHRHNARACVERLDAIFASRDYAEWCEIMTRAQGAWAPMQRPIELHDDAQAHANGYLADIEMIDGSLLTLATSPAQFDEKNAVPHRAPELGEHTEASLPAVGLSWDALSDLKERKIVG